MIGWIRSMLHRTRDDDDSDVRQAQSRARANFDAWAQTLKEVERVQAMAERRRVNFGHKPERRHVGR